MKVCGIIDKSLKKVFLFMTMILVLTVINCINVSADESMRIGVDQYRTEEGKLVIYVNHNKDESFSPTLEESSMLVGKQNLVIESAEKFKDTKEPVSYIFMVDISGSMDKSRIEIIKETLKKWVAVKRDEDNMCISTMGDELISSGFSNDSNALYSFIDSIEVTRQDTDLYKSIKEELNVLKTDKNVHQKRCLVIFSDGVDDQKDGITKEEAETQVRDSHIPIFTVALLPKNYKEKDIENSKILGSFARYSAGGEHYVPQVDKFECQDVCDKVTSILYNSLVVKGDLAEVTAADGDIYIGVTLSDGSATSTDGMQIPVGNILDAIKQAQSVMVNVNINKDKSEVEVETMTTTEVVVEEKGTNIPVIIAIIVVLIIIMVVIVILLINKKQQPQESEEISSMMYSESSSGNTIGFASGSAVSPSPSVEPGKINSSASSASGSLAKKLTLYKVGPGADEKKVLVIDGKKSVGRNNSCDWCINNDKMVSGIHCHFYVKNKKIHIKDNNSTNGTMVNGIPLNGEYLLENGDIIAIGGSEYRVYYE